MNPRSITKHSESSWFVKDGDVELGISADASSPVGDLRKVR